MAAARPYWMQEPPKPSPCETSMTSIPASSIALSDRNHLLGRELMGDRVHAVAKRGIDDS